MICIGRVRMYTFQKMKKWIVFYIYCTVFPNHWWYIIDLFCYCYCQKGFTTVYAECSSTLYSSCGLWQSRIFYAEQILFHFSCWKMTGEELVNLSLSTTNYPGTQEISQHILFVVFAYMDNFVRSFRLRKIYLDNSSSLWTSSVMKSRFFEFLRQLLKELTYTINIRKN